MCICALSLSAASANALREFKFELLPNGTGHGEATVEQLGDNGFKMRVRNTDSNNYGIAMANFDFTGTAQHKLAFRVTGAPQNAGTNIAVVLLNVTGENNWTGNTVYLGSFTNTDPKTVVLSLNNDFQLSDATYRFVQLKFSCGGGQINSTDTEVTISDVRLVTADELNAGSADFVVYPAKEKHAAERKGVKVFFDFENDDKNAYVTNGDKTFDDPVPSFGYAEMLLEHTEGLFCVTDNIDEADAIVYSRVLAGENGAAIADAVKNRNIPLFTFGAIPDEAVAAVAPMTLTARKYTTLAEHEMIDGRVYPLYFDAQLQRGEALLKTQSGNVLAARDGAVTQYAFGIGNNLLGKRSPVFFDRGLLEQLLKSVGKDTAVLDARESEVLAQRAEAERALTQDVLRDAGMNDSNLAWRTGASKDNVGRFAWMIGEGLSFGTLSKDLTLGNDSASVRIAVGNTTQWALPNWKLAVISGDVTIPENADENCLWSGLGTVEYSLDFSFPESADKDGNFFFEVRDGIDDIDEAYFNGTKIGATDAKTPFYWIAPRRYAIPSELINRDGLNHLSVKVTNLYGNAGFNSKPIITMSNTTPSEIRVTQTSWSGKTYQVTEKNTQYELQFSLHSPFVRYGLGELKNAGLALENVADYAAYRTEDGWRIIPLDGSVNKLYERGNSPKMTAPWLLCFRKESGRPVLIVFQHEPQQIGGAFRDGLLERLNFESDRALGDIFVGWPYGVSVIDCTNWCNELPAEVIAKIELDGARALAWPQGCDEIYALDRENERVEIIDRFKLRACENDWGIAGKASATLPPLVGELLAQNQLATCEEELSNFQCDTMIGGTWGKDGNTIRYSLPLPDGKEFYPTCIKDDVYYPAGNRLFTIGVKYSSGGGTPLEARTSAHPYGNIDSLHSICMFRFQFGLATVLQEGHLLNDVNRNAALNRIRLRHCEPFELYQYKSVARYRVEPYSGIWYPIMFNSFYPLGVNFAPGFGSSVNYGDANEGYVVCLWCASILGDMYGQQGMVKNNWNWYRNIARYATVLEDYAYMASPCRDSGIGAWVDMLDAEFSGMLAYHRLAKLAGDDAEADRALYYAARRSVPTLARLYCADYALKLNPSLNDVQFQVNGFGEDGIHLERHPTDSGNFRCANDLFNCSEGYPGALTQLYLRYGKEKVTEHIEERSWPSLTGPDTKYFSYNYLSPLAIFAKDAQRVDQYGKETVANSEWNNMADWPNMTYLFDLAHIPWRLYDQVNLSCVEGLTLHQAEYQPSSKQLIIRCTATDASRLAFEASRPVKTIIRNGQAVKPTTTALGYELPLLPGENTFVIQL